MLIRILLGIGQLIHVFTSLGALLLLAQDLVGSINVISSIPASWRPIPWKPGIFSPTGSP